MCTLLGKNLSTGIGFKQVILKRFLRLSINIQPVQLISPTSITDKKNPPPAFTTIMQYNMYHERRLDAQNAQPIPMPEGGRSNMREAEGREPAAAGHGNRGAILAGAAVSPPGPQRIIAQSGLRSIQTSASIVSYY